MGVLDKAAAKAEGAELYEEVREGVSAEFRGGELEKVASQAILGRALRVIHEKKLGFASTAGEEEDELVAAALTSAKHGDPAPFHFPPLRGEARVDVSDEEVLSLTPSDLISLGERAVRTIRDEFPEIIVDASVARGTIEVHITNTSGGERRERRTYVGMSVEAQRVREGDIWFIWRNQVVRRKADLDPAALVGGLANYLRWGRNTVTPPTGNQPVLFVPDGALVPLLPVMVGFSGLSVYLGTSPLQGKRGERIFDERLTIVDDGTLPFGPRSGSFDDEGLPMTQLPWVEEGVVKNFYYDLRAATLAKADPTGNGLKGSPLDGGGFRVPPAPAPRNIVVQPGEGTLGELIAEMGDGLIVANVIGLGQGNVESGVFSTNVSVGFAVKGGQVVGRVKNTMIAGNVYQLLKDGVVAIGGQTEWCHGTYKSPPLLVRGVSVVAR